MIRSFRHKGLRALFVNGRGEGVRPDLRERCIECLDALDDAKLPRALNLPGYRFHALRGLPHRYTIHVNGPWCITFEWQGVDAIRVNLEQYH
jgi:proteic killer suppression protein